MQSIDKQGNDMQSGDVQRMAVLPLGELIRLHHLVPGAHDIQQHFSLIDRQARPQVATGITLSALFHPWQPSPTNFFVNHGISSPSSSSYRQTCSPREFTFRVLLFITKATQGLPCFARSF
jgi:hypothetical protein